jgi:hypothetical protein
MRHIIGMLMIISSPLIVFGLIGYMMWFGVEHGIPFGEFIAPAWFLAGTLLVDPASSDGFSDDDLDCDTADESLCV